MSGPDCLPIPFCRRSHWLPEISQPFPIHPGCRHEAHPIPPLHLPHGRHLGTRWVRVAIDDPFVRSGPDPQVAKAAKDAADALVLEDTQLRKMTLPAGAEAYSSRAE